MGSWWRWLALLAVWWLAVFFVQRALFLAFALQNGGPVPLAESSLTFYHGASLDLSATGYYLLVTALLSVPLLFRNSAVVRTFLYRWTLLLLCITALIGVVDIGLFDAWGAKLDRKAINYLRYPKEAASGASWGWMALLLGVAVVQVVVFERALRWIDFARDHSAGDRTPRIASVVLATALCLVAARGGPQDDPINKSWAYFSRHPVLNLAALNSVWNALEIAVEPAEVGTNPYRSMASDEAARLFALPRSKDAQRIRAIVKDRHPNILLVLLESWTADVIEPLGGDSGVTPAFTKLAQDGLLFTNFYSTGFRTEQGLCALISGFPAQPKTTIMRNYGKFDKLPSLVGQLHDAGYASTYWYAGNTEFANTRAYLEAMGFDRIHDEQDFLGQAGTEWGAFDKALFDLHLERANSEQQPFFHVVMTSTSHEPFNAPVEQVFKGAGEPDRYRNTVHYTDACLGAFLQAARTQPWYANTLVVVVSDHGHYLPHYRDAFSDARHRVPFLITGGALREELRGTAIATYASHVDVPAMLLHQLGADAGEFTWSRDPLDPSVPHHVLWTFNEGFGIADSTQSLAFDLVGDRIIELRDRADTADQQRLLLQGRADIQVLLDQYIGFNQ